MSDLQTAQSQFSQLVFAFEAVNVKTGLGWQTTKDVAEYLRRRSQIEAEYAKKLSELYKTTPGSGFFTTSNQTPISKESTALRTVLNAIQEKGLKTAEKHLEFSNKINTEIVNALENYAKAKDPERKKIVIEGQKYLKTLADAKGIASRAKGAFDAAMKEAEIAQEQLEKANKDQINQPENKKLQPITAKASARFEQCKAKAKELETSYNDTIKKANDELEKFVKEGMPGVLNQLHKWEEERWNTVLKLVKEYSTLQDAIPNAIVDYVTELRTITSEAKIENDFKEFIEATLKTAKEEKPLEFVPYAGKFQLEGGAQEEQKQELSKVEEKKEEKPSFSGLTAEEKLEQSKTEPEEDKALAEERQKKKAEAQKKAEEIKSTLFSSDQDLFKD